MATWSPQRRFRCPDRLWHAAVRVADERGTTVSAVLRSSLEQYVEGTPWTV